MGLGAAEPSSQPFRGTGLVARLAAATRKLTSLAVRVLGPALVALACVIVGLVAYCFFALMLPLLHRGAPGHALVGVYLLVKVVTHYALVVATAPGSPRAEDMTDEEVEHLRSAGLEGWCRKCNLPKPARTHHCSTCDRCVLVFDHHCPWVANCVGHHNYKHFVFFIFFTWIGCWYVTFVAGICMFGGLEGWATFSSGDRASVLSVFVVTASLVVTLGLLLGWHLYLICTAQTTVEFYYNLNSTTGGNLFDKGSWRRNLSDALGEPTWKWLLPTGGPPRPGDGIHIHIETV